MLSSNRINIYQYEIVHYHNMHVRIRASHEQALQKLLPPIRPGVQLLTPDLSPPHHVINPRTQSGHYLWPAAPALSAYLVEQRRFLPGGAVLELGAGYSRVKREGGGGGEVIGQALFIANACVRLLVVDQSVAMPCHDDGIIQKRPSPPLLDKNMLG